MHVRAPRVPVAICCCCFVGGVPEGPLRRELQRAPPPSHHGGARGKRAFPRQVCMWVVRAWVLFCIVARRTCSCARQSRTGLVVVLSLSLSLSLSRGLCEPSSCEFKVVWSGLVASQGSEYNRYYVVLCVLAMAQIKLWGNTFKTTSSRLAAACPRLPSTRLLFSLLLLASPDPSLAMVLLRSLTLHLSPPLSLSLSQGGLRSTRRFSTSSWW